MNRAAGDDNASDHPRGSASLGADLPVRRAGMVGTSFYEPLPVGLSDLIEDSAVIEMRFLGLLPVANNLSEGEELHVREPVCVFREDLFVLRAKIALGGKRPKKRISMTAESSIR